MPLTTTVLSRQLEELNLLKHSLLPGEELVSVPPSEGPDHWAALLDAYLESTGAPELDAVAHALTPAHLRIQVSGSETWFDVRLDEDYDGGRPGGARYSVSVRGATLARGDQEAWQAFVQEKTEEVQDSEYPVLELVSTHLLPRLHAESDASERAQATPPTPRALSPVRDHYHALFTSHHLVSPTKRRSLQQWSASLSVAGFAKVGHPGVIYCEGDRVQVEEFVANVKAMQWLALRLRFIEPLLDEFADVGQTGRERRRWMELEKVGEVVEEMRRLGRERYVVEMGIGSASTNIGTTK